MKERTFKLSFKKAKIWYNSNNPGLKGIALELYTKEELTLPTTWEKYIEVLDINKEYYYIDTSSTIKPILFEKSEDVGIISDKNLLPSAEAAEAHLALMQLHMLRDYYRQGDIPNWEDNVIKYCIINTNKGIIKDYFYNTPHFLSFNTEEIRDEFYNNFKDLITKAKDLI